MSDRTPADVIAESFKIVGGAGEPGLPPSVNPARIMNALAAAGFRVVPIPDDNTRALAARARSLLDAATPGTWQRHINGCEIVAGPWRAGMSKPPTIVYLPSDHKTADAELIAATPDLVAGLLAAAYLDGQPK